MLGKQGLGLNIDKPPRQIHIPGKVDGRAVGGDPLPRQRGNAHSDIKLAGVVGDTGGAAPR